MSLLKNNAIDYLDSHPEIFDLFLASLAEKVHADIQGRTDIGLLQMEEDDLLALMGSSDEQIEDALLEAISIQASQMITETATGD